MFFFVEWLKDEEADEDDYDDGIREKIQQQKSEEQRVMEESSAALAGVVGMSPKQRYLRFEEELGKGSSLHNSYRAFDTRNGIQVSWHAVHLETLSHHDYEQVTSIISYQKDIVHKNIIQYMSCWSNEEQSTLNIITPFLDNLKEFSLKKCSRLRWRIVKKWCRQILTGLTYLHTSQPVVIHSLLTCSHIYIDGGFGGSDAIKLGRSDATPIHSPIT